VVFGAWQVPFLLKLGAEGAARIYVNDVGHRFLDSSWFSFSTHLAEYPFETLACLLPWSGLMIVWCNGRFRRTLGQAGAYAVFLAFCLAVPFPSVWLPPGSRPRYFMCLYPCVALLAGLIANRVSRTRNHESWRIVWPVFVRVCAAAMMGIIVWVLVLSLADINTWLKPPIKLAIPFVLASAPISVLAWWSPARPTAVRRCLAVLSIAGFVALSHNTLLINAFLGTTVDTAGAIAELKRQIPSNTRLVSFGPTHHMFVYYYHEQIPVCPWPETVDDADDSIRYFCAEPSRLENEPLPFAWEKVADISCDRHHLKQARSRVIVGRRTDLAATASNQGASAAAHRN